MDKKNMALTDDDLGIVTGGQTFTSRPARSDAQDAINPGDQAAGGAGRTRNVYGSQVSGIVSQALGEGGTLSAGEGMVV